MLINSSIWIQLHNCLYKFMNIAFLYLLLYKMEKLTRKVLIGGNWKCNGDSSFIESFHSSLEAFKVDDSSKAEVFVFPPSIHLQSLSKKYPHIVFGSQNVSAFGNGAYTGELSPLLLKDIGINTTLIAHSERRSFFGDNEEVISAKLKNAEANGMYIVMCIGEKLEERESGNTMKVIISQLETVKHSITNWANIALAYEPVWAIGTGKTASPEQAEEVHAQIREWLAKNISKEVADATRIIYGGSVNGGNSDKLIAQANIDGFLVGGASLKSEFKTIIDSYKLK
jgi:triosephosphate isomerase (TIM)